MIKLNDISIRNKLILMQVFTSVIVFGIVFGVFIITDINSYKQSKADSMISLAKVIGTNSISSIQFQDPESASQMLEELHTVAPEIIHALITNDKGETFASFSKNAVDTFNIPEILQSRSAAFSKFRLFVSNPIISNNKVIGRVYLEVGLKELQQTKDYKYKIAIILLLVALVFSFLIALLIQSYISNRLLKLVKTMRSVRNTGEFSKPVEDSGKDEIGILTKAYNLLMEKVDESQRRKDEFIGIASHELKTPLTSIKGYVEMLNTVEEDPTKKKFVEKTLGNINKLERLVKDLLDVSKIQSGQLLLDKKEFNMNQLIDEAIAASQMMTGTHQILRKECHEEQIINGDRQRLEQVLLNLLSNAIKYSPGENKVIVESEKTENELIIKIKDFGIGVPEEEKAQIFERFYRTKEISIHISGFGLGLYICRDIINRHNGRIWVESNGKGSEFYFSLPLKQTSTPQ